MSYFITPTDIKKGRKVLYKGRIVTPIDSSGAVVRLAEDGEWHPHVLMSPLTEDQMREDLIQEMGKLVSGRQIITLKAKGRGVQFVLDDNTRVGLTYTSGTMLELSVVNSDGKRIL